MAPNNPKNKRGIRGNRIYGQAERPSLKGSKKPARQRPNVQGRPVSRTVGTQQPATPSSRPSLASGGTRTGLPSPAAGAGSVAAWIRSHPRRSAIIALAAVLVAFAIAYPVACAPAQITVNGEEVQVAPRSTIAQVMEQVGLHPTPGRLLAIDDSVLDETGGTPHVITVNSKPADVETRIERGDIVNINDGLDQRETTTVADTPVPGVVESDDQEGPVHHIEGTTTDGVKTLETGDVSGLVMDRGTVEEVVNAKMDNQTIDTWGQMLVALTFEDGPTSALTGRMLDVLAANGARATFFVCADQIEQSEECAQLVQRAAAEGHQISVKGYDSSLAKSFASLSYEEQAADIEHAQQVLDAVVPYNSGGTVRLEESQFSTDVAKGIAARTNYVVDWTIDTRDAARASAADIENALLGANAGSIVRLHDGGTATTATVEALEVALPQLAAQGAIFVTVDNLLLYAV